MSIKYILFGIIYLFSMEMSAECLEMMQMLSDRNLRHINKR